jgi:uncharacterized membrane protein YvlD (DUF360 family)
MRSFLIHWMITAVALGVTAHFVPGIVVTSTDSFRAPVVTG